MFEILEHLPYPFFSKEKSGYNKCFIITFQRGSLSTTESNLHYKNEAKIDEAIRKLEWQLKVQNFKVAEERRIVAEIDKLKRSKKVLV